MPETDGGPSAQESGVEIKENENPLAVKFRALRQDAKNRAKTFASHIEAPFPGPKEQKEEALIQEVCDTASSILDQYKILWGEIQQSDLFQKADEEFMTEILSPRANQLVANGELTEEERDKYFDALNSYLADRDNKDKERAYWTVTNTVPSKLSSASYSQVGFPGAVESFFKDVTATDIASLYAPLRGTLSPDQQKAALKKLQETIDPEHHTRKRYDDLEGYPLIYDIFEDNVAGKISRSGETSSLGHGEAWLERVRSSPVLRKVFGDSVKEFDEKAYKTVLKESFSDYDGIAIRALKYYATPEAVSTLFVLASNEGKLPYNVRRTLRELMKTDDWEEKFARAKEAYPSLQGVEPVLQEFVSENAAIAPLQEATKNLTLSLITSELEKGDEADQKKVRQAAHSLPRQELFNLINNGTLPMSEDYLYILVSKYGFGFAEELRLMQQEGSQITRDFSDTLLTYIRNHGGRVSYYIEEDARENFRNQVSDFLNEASKQQSVLRPFVSNGNFLILIAERPAAGEELIRIAREAPEFFSLLNEDGPLHKYTKFILREIFKDDAPRKAKDIATIVQEVPGFFSLLTEGGPLQKYAKLTLKDFFNNADMVQRAKDIAFLPQEVPDFFPLLEEGSPLYTNAAIILENIFKHNDIFQEAKKYATAFTKKVPYWKQLFLFTEARLGDRLASATSEYPVAVFPKVISSKAGIQYTEDFSFVQRPIKDMGIREKKLIADLDDMDDAAVAGLVEIPFSRLRGDYKKMVFANLLYETFTRSREDNYKREADRRNREAPQKLVLKKGMYAHASPIDFLDASLLYGNLPGEALGEKAKADSFPFHVDFARITRNSQSVKEVLTESISGTHGIHGKHWAKGQIFYIYDREASSWQKSESSGFDEGHALVLGGMPSTEISAIVLTSPETVLQQAQQSVVDSGFYIPIYNLNGELMFSSEEYDRALEGKKIESVLRKEAIDDAQLTEIIPEWARLIGPEGYQHNKVLLGDHLKEAVRGIKQLPEYEALSTREKNLALVATLFHDIGKPTGTIDEAVQRDYAHEIPSARIATEYLQKWGYSEEEIKIVSDVIINDGVVSDIAAGIVMDESRRLTPEQLRDVLGDNKSAIRILRAVNRADATVVVGLGGFLRIASFYDGFFDEMLTK